jgi:succinate dehydrogenase flavin-adding protein (antitoxin of CptAB toxin-antitoxin module)
VPRRTYHKLNEEARATLTQILQQDDEDQQHLLHRIGQINDEELCQHLYLCRTANVSDEV